VERITDDQNTVNRSGGYALLRWTRVCTESPAHPARTPEGAAKTERQKRNAGCRGMETQARQLEMQAKSLYGQAKAT